MDRDIGTLVVIDVQRAFDDPAWGKRNNPQAETNIARLLSSWRERGAPVIHVRHVSEQEDGRFSVGSPGHLAKPEAEERRGEPVLTKTVNSAFIGTDLRGMLERLGGGVVCVGITTDHCVSTTVRMSANYGFATIVVSDATATFERRGPDGRHWPAQQLHDSALASLNDEFARVAATDELLPPSS